MVPPDKSIRLKGTFNLMKYGNKTPSRFKIPFRASQGGKFIPLGKHFLSSPRVVSQEGQKGPHPLWALNKY